MNLLHRSMPAVLATLALGASLTALGLPSLAQHATEATVAHATDTAPRPRPEPAPRPDPIPQPRPGPNPPPPPPEARAVLAA